MGNGSGKRGEAQGTEGGGKELRRKGEGKGNGMGVEIELRGSLGRWLWGR